MSKLFFNELRLKSLFLYTFPRHLNKLICLKKEKETILYLAYIDISFVLHCLTPLSPLILHYFMVMALAETIQYFKFIVLHLSKKKSSKKNTENLWQLSVKDIDYLFLERRYFGLIRHSAVKMLAKLRRSLQRAFSENMKKLATSFFCYRELTLSEVYITKESINHLL